MWTKVAVSALVTVFVVPGGAAARGGGWPHATLVTDSASGEGSFAGATWAMPSRSECAIAVVDGEYGFPSPPVQWVPGTEIAVRLESPERPRHVDAIAFLLGDPTTGTPVYGKVDIPNEVRRVEVDGDEMWEAVLSPPPWPDLYLEVTAEWKRVPDCGPRRATWKWRTGVLPA